MDTSVSIDVLSSNDFENLQFVKPNLSCLICHKDFTHRKSLLRHERTIHGNITHKCSICNATFNRLDKLNSHVKSHTKKSMKRTHDEEKIKPSKRHHPSPNARKRCLNTFQTQYIYPCVEKCHDPQAFLQSVHTDLINEIVELIDKGIKWYLNMKVRFTRKISETENEECISYFRSNCDITLSGETPNIEKAKEKVRNILSFYLKHRLSIQTNM
jgi:hypothetical protein